MTLVSTVRHVFKYFFATILDTDDSTDTSIKAETTPKTTPTAAAKAKPSKPVTTPKTPVAPVEIKKGNLMGIDLFKVVTNLSASGNCHEEIF